MHKNQIKTINEIAKSVHDTAKLKGWYDKPESEYEFIERTCNNMHDEVSELHEAWRNGKADNLCDKEVDMVKEGISPLTCTEEELADIVIRAFDSAARLGVNIGSAIYRKMLFNKTRPYRHGGKKS